MQCRGAVCRGYAVPAAAVLSESLLELRYVLAGRRQPIGLETVTDIFRLFSGEQRFTHWYHKASLCPCHGDCVPGSLIDRSALIREGGHLENLKSSFFQVMDYLLREEVAYLMRLLDFFQHGVSPRDY